MPAPRLSSANPRAPSNGADIPMSDADMTLGLKTVITSCMSIKPSVLEPAPCLSSTGRATGAMFGAHGSGSDNSRPKSAAALQDYAKLYSKLCGASSLAERVAAASKADTDSTGMPIGSLQVGRSQTAPDDDDGPIDVGREIGLRAARESRAKYLTPHLASKYGGGAGGGGANGGAERPLTSPAVQGLTVVHRGAPTGELAANAADAAAVAGLLEAAAAAEDGERARLARAAAAAGRRGRAATAPLHRSGGDGSGGACVGAPGAPGGRLSTSAFASVSRERAQRVSVRSGTQSSGVLGPGNYSCDAYFKYLKPNVASPQLVPRSYGAARHGPDGADGGLSEWGRGDGGESSSSRRGTASTTDQLGLPEEQPRRSDRPPVHTVFKDAHHVHGGGSPGKPNEHQQRPATAGGSSSFLAVPRPNADVASAGGHLALTYFSEGYDAFTLKSVKLVTRFESQTTHSPCATAADTPPSLGPGSYFSGRGGGRQLTSRTGGDLAAGHDVSTRGTLDFGRSVARPGPDGPPGVAPTSAWQQQQQRGGHEPEVGASDGAAALHAMYGPLGADLNPSTLISIQTLEAHTPADVSPGGGQRRRPATAGADGAGAGGASPRGGLAGPRPLGPAELDRFASAGLRKRVLGARMSSTTRAEATMGMRAMSRDGVIPPASGPLRMGAGADVSYEPQDQVMAHRHKSPAWKLPPNRNALSSNWVSSAALAYIE
ncbi:hypothetical protein FOA52_014908 [Chlamydomonas sp. UWO 241]|nr:hypothetical protein FOA52_014908 [Chlamydomonas sp. UWO 241]